MTSNNQVQEALIETYCKQLKLPGVGQIYQQAARAALESNQSFSSYLAACLSHEIETRKERQLERWLKQARFPWKKSLSDFDFTLMPKLPKQKIISLAEGSFIRNKENVICVGASGTGKTHTAVALGLSAIQAGYRTRFIKVVDLVQELLAAEKEFILPKYLKSWNKIPLVILDELGYLGLGPGGPLLFQFCAERYESGSFIITTNLEFSRWSEVFGDVTLTTALLDRLTHRSYVLLFEGESYRFRERCDRQGKEKK